MMELPPSGPSQADRHEELMSPANEPRQSKAERTAAAREKAREIREAQLKKDKRNKLLIGWGIVVAVVAIIVIVALVVTSNIKNNAPVADEGPTPANGNIHGGVTLLANTEVAKTDPATVKLSDLPSAPATPPSPVTAPGAEAEAGKPVKVVLYIDFICPVCKNFEAQYNETLTSCATRARSPWSTARSDSWTAGPPRTTPRARPTPQPAWSTNPRRSTRASSTCCSPSSRPKAAP